MVKNMKWAVACQGRRFSILFLVLWTAILILPVVKTHAEEPERNLGLRRSATPDVEGTVARILTAVDIDVDLEFVQLRIQQMLEQGKNELPSASAENINEVLDTAFAPERLRRILSHVIVARAEPEKLSAILDWFEGPVAQKITREKNKIMTLAGYKKMHAYRDNPQSAPPSAKRLELLYKLDHLSGASANEDLILQDMQTAYVQALSFYTPPRPQFNGLAAGMVSDQKLVEERIKAVARNIAVDRAQVKQRNILTLAYILRPISDAEIEQYIEFFESAPGEHWKMLENESSRLMWADINGNHIALQMGQPIGKLDQP